MTRNNDRNIYKEAIDFLNENGFTALNHPVRVALERYKRQVEILTKGLGEVQRMKVYEFEDDGYETINKILQKAEEPSQ